MRIVPSCEKCLYEKQEKVGLAIDDAGMREAFLKEIREVLEQRNPDDCAPYVVSLFRKVQEKYLGKNPFPAEIKKEYNQLMLSIEDKITERIQEAGDPLEKSMIYARIGNYIDFGAMHQVKQEELLDMLEKEANVSIDPGTYREFLAECEKGKKFLLLCDNCGEIVLDKLFLRELKKRFPQLEIFAMVRGEEVLNDATMEDSIQSGLDREAIVVANGNGVAGTVWELLNPGAQQVLQEADVVLSKGQGNYESLFGYHKPVYYSFLCKCDLFISRFQVPKFTGMFVREVR